MCIALRLADFWTDVPRCPHFADRGGGPDERDRFCAEHGHEIPSFKKLTVERRRARRVCALA